MSNYYLSAMDAIRTVCPPFVPLMLAGRLDELLADFGPDPGHKLLKTMFNQESLMSKAQPRS